MAVTLGFACGGSVARADAGQRASASLRYFHSLTGLVKDLNTGKDTRTLTQRRYWYEQCANRIDALPLCHIDF
jgi:hypothetical protein